MRFFFTRIFPSIFIIVGASTLFFGVRDMTRAKASTEWPTTPGVIKESRVGTHTSDDSTTYHAEIRYAFTVNSQPYLGKKIAFGDYGSSNPSHAKNIVKRYPEGKDVTVHYLPRKPSVSVLEPGLQGQAWFKPLFGSIFLVAGLAMAFLLPRQMKKGKTSSPAPETASPGFYHSDPSTEPLDLKHNNTGILPCAALHQRNGRFIQEASYSHFVFMFVMLILAGGACFLPLKITTTIGPLKFLIAGMFAWGGICSLFSFFLRNALGQTVTIDPRENTVVIRKRNNRQTIPWSQIQGLQIIKQPADSNSHNEGYQLNLMYRDTTGLPHRQNLHKHVARRFVVALGRQYAEQFGFSLYDQTSTDYS
jgi:hypothetical protein